MSESRLFAGRYRQTAGKLAAMGVTSITDFLALPPRQVRRLFSVVGERVQAELQGISCLPLALAPPVHQGLAVTRSFGRLVTTWDELREALAAYTARAAEKLRRENLEAGLDAFDLLLKDVPIPGSCLEVVIYARKMDPNIGVVIV